MKKSIQIVVILLVAILYSCGPSEAEEKLKKQIADSIAANKIADELSKSLESAMNPNETILDTTIDNTHIVIKRVGESGDTAATGIKGSINLNNSNYLIKDIDISIQTKPLYEKKRKEKSYIINFNEAGTISEFWIDDNSICNFDLTIRNNKKIKFTRTLHIAWYELIIDVND